MARNSEVCASSGIYVVHVYCCGELGGVGVAGITEVANVNAMEREGPKMNWTAQRKKAFPRLLPSSINVAPRLPFRTFRRSALPGSSHSRFFIQPPTQARISLAPLPLHAFPPAMSR
ncbi:hypothetical protein IG631_11715 [Alternaria alternata]|nr:hypothetical protein IG631_11715 [Alternaria alternata]